MKHPSRSNLGLSLLEIMLALGILAVAALSLLLVFTNGAKLMQRSNEMAAANSVAKSVIEGIKLDYRQHQNDLFPGSAYIFDGRKPDPEHAGPAPFPPAPYPSQRVNGENYFVVVEGEDQTDSLKRLKVSVYWHKSEALELETFLHL